MLSAANRLRRSADYALAVRRGRRNHQHTLGLHLLATPGESPPRVGFVVGRAVGAAVTRNQVKRRLRHLVRARMDGLGSGSVLVVRARPAAATASAATLAADLDRALDRLLPAPGAR